MQDVAQEDLGFVNEEVDKIIVESIQAVLGGQQYQEVKTQQWINQILERIMKQLNDLGRPFKYMATCMIQQKNGAGFYTTNAFFWDSINDGFVTKTWPDSRNKDQQNKTMQAVVTVFGIVF